MKCQILFSVKNKKNINLSSTDLAQRAVKVKQTYRYFHKHTVFLNLAKQKVPHHTSKMHIQRSACICGSMVSACPFRLSISRHCK